MATQARTQTQTQTQTQTLTLPKLVSRSRFTIKHNNDPDDDGESPGSNSGSSPADDEDVGLLPCNEVVNVYAVFKILYRLRGNYHGANGQKYHMVKVAKQNPREAMKTLLDPVEYELHEKFFFNEDDDVLIPYVTSYPKPMKDDDWLFVRCKNNSLHIIPPSALVNNIAKQRYDHSRAPTKLTSKQLHTKQQQLSRLQSGKQLTTKKPMVKTKQELDKLYNFEREVNDSNRKIAILNDCHGIRTNECKEAFESSCNDQVKDPKVLKAVYDYGARALHKGDRTWEEICFETDSPVNTGANRSRVAATHRARTAMGAVAVASAASMSLEASPMSLGGKAKSKAKPKK